LPPCLTKREKDKRTNPARSLIVKRRKGAWPRFDQKVIFFGERERGGGKNKRENAPQKKSNRRYRPMRKKKTHSSVCKKNRRTGAGSMQLGRKSKRKHQGEKTKRSLRAQGRKLIPKKKKVSSLTERMLKTAERKHENMRKR